MKMSYRFDSSTKHPCTFSFKVVQDAYTNDYLTYSIESEWFVNRLSLSYKSKFNIVNVLLLNKFELF